MNIVKIKPNVVKFSQIYVGDCFEWDNYIYLRTCKFRDYETNGIYNAINLDSNTFEFFYGEIDVIKVNATLSIDYNMGE